MNREELKEFLDFKANQYENPDFLESDPIQLPHRFSKKEDIEIVAFLVSTIAWGNRKAIIKSGEKLLNIMEFSPHEFILNGNFDELNFVHRTFNQEDLKFFFHALRRIYQSNGLEAAFLSEKTNPNVKDRIINFRNEFFQDQHDHRSRKHISDPVKNAACKRINMFLRWMVRPNAKGVDFGIWNSIPTSDLLLPLDVHTGNNARRLGLLDRKQDNWQALEELMVQLRKMDPRDPVKYDFALFGLGAFEGF